MYRHNICDAGALYVYTDFNAVTMEDIDTQGVSEQDDHDLMLRHVVQAEPDLLFLDSYLADSLRGRSTRGASVIDPADDII